jgi:hypothetical protein
MLKTEINQLAINFDADEDFEVGRQALVEFIPCILHFKDTSQFPRMAQSLKSDEQKLAAFWFAYFTARLKIEQSYDFTLANQCFDWGVEQLDAMQNQALRPANCVLLKAQIAVMLVDEDRGMHNNHFYHTQQSCEKALALIAEQTECQAELEYEISYIEAILALSKLLAKRDSASILRMQNGWKLSEYYSLPI